MKCNNCRHKQHHFPDDADTIINYCGDPYDYDYCDLFQWTDSPDTDPTLNVEKCEYFDKIIEFKKQKS